MEAETTVLEQQLRGSIAIAKVTGDARQLLTQSRLAAARSCQRFHHLRYDQGVRAVQDQHALRFGSLVHQALEAWWRSTGNRLADALAVVNLADCDEYDRARAVVMMTGYDLRWREEPYDVLAVEQEFCTDLVNPETGAASRTWCLAGKIDVIVRDRRDGLVRNIEHKTSSEDISAGSAYWARLRMDSQISVYFVGARSLGYDIAGCLYDVLGKPSLKPLQVNSRRSVPETPDEYRERCAAAVAEDPARYFARGEVVRLDSEMHDAMLDVWQLGQQMRESRTNDRAPKNPDACMKWNRPCEFFELCSGAASIDDASKFLRSANIHPELNMTKEVSQ